MDQEMKKPVPWWLVLIDGVIALAIGLLLVSQPYKATFWLMPFLGLYWLIDGVIDIALIFADKRMWGWKLFMGIVGIVAGLILVMFPVLAGVVVVKTFVLLLGISGIILGIARLVQAFQGAGWGAAILGVLSIILGIIILGDPVKFALAAPWLLGVFLIAGGFLAIWYGFKLRPLQKQAKEAAAAVPPTMVRTAEVPVQPAVPAAPAEAAIPAAAVGMAAAAEEAMEEPVETSVEETVEAAAEVEVAEEAAELSSLDAMPEEAAVVAAAVAEPEMAEAEEAVAGEAAPVESKAEQMALAVEEMDEAKAAELALKGHDLQFVEGIGPAFAGKLNAVGLNNTLDLLEKGSTPKGRQELAEQTGIALSLILTWVNHADLFRIKGVGSQYADLLEEAGVDTVVELAMRNPVNLFAKLTAVNEEKNLVRKLPTDSQVESWVSQAKELPRKVFY